MKLSPFEEANVTFVGEGCDDMIARRYTEQAWGGVPVVETRYQLSDREREAIANGAAIVVKLVCVNPQPQWIGVILDGKVIE